MTQRNTLGKSSKIHSYLASYLVWWLTVLVFVVSGFIFLFVVTLYDWVVKKGKE